MPLAGGAAAVAGRRARLLPPALPAGCILLVLLLASSRAPPRTSVPSPSAPARGGKAAVLIAGAGTAGTSTPGGARNVGRLFAENLLKMGADVACVVRSEAAAAELEGAGLRVAGVGDLTDASFVDALVQSAKPSTIFTSVGGKDAGGGRVDGTANINLFRAAAGLSQRPHVVFVTSWGCGETWEHLDDETRKLLGPALRAKTEAEEFLRSSGLNHMIVRPGGLMSGEEPPTMRGVLIQGRPDVGGAIRRQDLAQMLLWLPRRAETNGLAVTALDQDMLRADPPLKEGDILPLAPPG